MRAALTSFTAVGLHNDRDVSLDMRDEIRILVDENGSGKTTMLALLYNLLKPDLRALARIRFEELRLEFDGERPIAVSQKSLAAAVQPFIASLRENRIGQFLIHRVGEGGSESTAWDLMGIAERAQKVTSRALFQDHRLRRVVLDSPFSHTEVAEALAAVLEESKERGGSEAGSELQRLRELIPNPVLYFPTYRRVEEDLRNLGYSLERAPSGELLIQFGMQDVRSRLRKVTTAIQESSVEWYSIVIGQMISQLTDGIQVTPEMRSAVENRNALEIVLARVGDSIQEEKKRDILRMVETGAIHTATHTHDPLVYFLYNLIQIYEKQREKDEEIKSFVAVANRYLRDKQIQYNESRLTISVLSDGREMQLNNLSSGEKQIVSIFSQIYLEPCPTPYIILFDEPELSLSIEWQRMLLPHIRESGRCAFLIAATHSPFVYDNNLDEYASQLRVVMRRSEVAPLREDDDEDVES